MVTKILVVDDSSTDLLIIQNMLRDFNIKVARNGLEAIQVIEADADEIIRVNRISWQDLAIWAKTIKTETGTARFGFPYGNVSSQLIYPITGMGLSMGEHTLPAFSDEGAVRA